MNEVLLDVKNLTVHFEQKSGFFKPKLTNQAVNQVSFQVRRGQTLGVVGESGCGKSTLARAIVRLLPATAGQVLWLGEDILKISEKEFLPKRQQIQMIFQDPLSSLNPRMTIGEIIEEPLKSFKKQNSQVERRQEVENMLVMVGLHKNMINRYPHEFSGGQCQRVGIARAMITKPTIVICDEPVSALDVSIQAQILNLLQDLQKKLNLSLVFISHDLSVVQHICHQILVLYLGKTMEFADKRTLFKDPKHPYTQALISAVPIVDPKLERQRKRILLEGDLPSAFNPPSGCVFRTRCPEAKARCAEQTPVATWFGQEQQVCCHLYDNSN